jgi:hypothetical protein
MASGGVRALRDALRTCLQIASGLTEATRRRASEAAQQLLDQAGVDFDELQRKVAGCIPPEVQTLADELIATGRANRDLLAGLIREEIDRTMARVGRLADDVTKVGVILEALERRVRSLEDTGKPAGPAPARERVPFADEAKPAAAPAEDAAPAEGAPAAAAVERTPEKKAAPVKKAVAKKAAPVKKAVAKKAAPVKKAVAKKAAPVKRAAPVKKAVAKKAAPAKKAARGDGEARDE